MTTLVISHKNCVDGFVSAYLMSLVYPDTIVMYAQYMKPLDMEYIDSIEDIDKIRIVDFSLAVDVLAELNKITEDIIIYDHHETATKIYSHGMYCTCVSNKESTKLIKSTGEFIGGPGKAIFTSILEEEKCASKIIYGIYKKTIDKALTEKFVELTKDELYINSSDLSELTEEEIKENDDFISSEPKILEKVINDVDFYDRFVDLSPSVMHTDAIIRFIFEHTHLLKSMPYMEERNEFDVFTLYLFYKHMGQYMGDAIETIRDSAAKVVLDRQIVLNNYLGRYKLHEFQGYKDIPFLSCPSDLVNYVGYELYKKYQFVFMYNLFTNGTVKVSLRAPKESGIDLTKIAGKYGGGGHKSAAGILMSMDDFKQLLLELK